MGGNTTGDEVATGDGVRYVFLNHLSSAVGCTIGFIIVPEGGRVDCPYVLGR